MAERNEQQNYWDANLDAQNLGGGTSASGESLHEELKFANTPDIQDMISALHPAPGHHILEIGSGLGGNAVLLARKGVHVIALDISHDRLVTLKTRTSGDAFHTAGSIMPVKARAEALPFRNGSLDAACSRAVLIHTDIPRVCKEVFQALKPEGHIAFSEPMAHNPLVKIYRATLAPGEWQGFTTYFTQMQIDVITSHFANTRTRFYYGLSFLAFAFQYGMSMPAAFYAALRPLRVIDSIVAKVVPATRRYAWFVLVSGRKRDAG